jgi:cell division protein FtsZ|uniref:Cell division protein FtsZ n=1 Tax=Desulfobacca acetoxidans TaxID=60893 RepID=A0A7C3WN73_9BACT
MKIQLVPSELSARIKVLGIGGAGGNAINDMIRSNMVGVDFIAANTDAMSLERSLAPVKIQLGPSVTRGLGAGGNPEVGREATKEESERIKQVLQGADMVFIAAGMGGGTGTGGAPIVAEISREVGALTVAVVSKPFEFEGKMKTRLAEKGIEELRQVADTIITIPNDRLFSLGAKNSRTTDIFAMANEVLGAAVRGISDLIMVPGFVKVDFADVRTIMREGGMALMGTGVASGSARASEAAHKAISHPLLEDISIRGARGILINITSSQDFSMEELREICTIIQEEAHEDALIKWGLVYDDSLNEELRVTVIATGIGKRAEPEREVPAWQPSVPETPAVEDLEIPTILRKGDLPRESTAEKRPPTLGVVSGRKYVVHPDLQYEESELDTPPFLRKVE